jgi:membrane protease YdiL (CAAX protease family)
MTRASQSPPGLLLRITHHPVSRIVIALLAVFVPVVVVQALLRTIGPPLDSALMFTLLSVPSTYSAYRVYVRVIENRQASELSMVGGPAELGRGIVFGAGLFSATIGIIAALGYYRVTGMNHWNVLLDSLTLAVMSGFLEELIARGIIFRILEEWLGTWIALTLSALLFGALHLGNPNATLASATAIALEAGLLLGACYILTRRLWLAVGLHLAWNFTQGGIFGVAVSGTTASGILQSTLTGPVILSGGAFGAEASIVAVFVCVAGFLFIIMKARRKGQIIQPFRSRSDGS